MQRPGQPLVLRLVVPLRPAGLDTRPKPLRQQRCLLQRLLEHFRKRTASRLMPSSSSAAASSGWWCHECHGRRLFVVNAARLFGEPLSPTSSVLAAISRAILRMPLAIDAASEIACWALRIARQDSGAPADGGLAHIEGAAHRHDNWPSPSASRSRFPT